MTVTVNGQHLKQAPYGKNTCSKEVAVSILDIIFFIALAAGIVLGLLRGLLKQIFALVGVVLIAIGTSYASPIASKMLQNIIESETTRSIVAVIATFIVLSIVYAVVTTVISHVINKTPVLGRLNRILGAAFAVIVVYLVFGFVTALVVETSSDFLAALKGIFDKSWVVTNIYGGAESPERNFFGHWLLRVLVEKIQSLAPEETALLFCA